MITKRNALNPPSKETISWFNNAYKVTLPQDYIDFIRLHNGETPEKSVFYTNGRDFAIDRFLCLLDKPSEDKNGWYDITTTLTQLDTRLIDNEDLIGMNVIPIAVLFAGDFVCLDFRKSKNPVVVVWYHEESDDFKPVTEKVANTFTEFLGMLRKE